MNKKYLAALMLIVVAGSFGIAGAMFSAPVASNEQISEGVEYTTAVTKTVYRINPDTGQYEVYSVDTTHNALSNAGREMMKRFLRGQNAQTANISTIAVGNSTGALAGGAGDTTLGSEIMSCGLSNVTAVNNIINQTAWDISWQWTSTCNNQIVNTTAIFNSTAAGGGAGAVLFAGANLTSSTLQNTDKIQVNYTINVG